MAHVVHKGGGTFHSIGSKLGSLAEGLVTAKGLYDIGKSIYTGKWVAAPALETAALTAAVVA